MTLRRGMKCFKCEELLAYCETWDAYYCEPCDVWVDRQCSDSNCCFCVERPAVPSGMEDGTP